jgi:hypothetical protein
MIHWSPIKLKFTLGIGSLASIALLSELSQKAIPTWLAVGIVMLSLGVVMFILQLLPNCSYLRVSSKGVEIRSLWRTYRYQWTDISHFYAGNIGPNKMVLMAFAPTYHHAQMGRTVSMALTGAEGALPGTYGFTAEALAERLNCWKTAHTPSEKLL